MKLSLTKKDFEYQWFSGKGAGGQHRNKHQNCFRIKHVASGAKATGQSSKERIANKRTAMQALAKNPLFRAWCNMKLKELETGESIEEAVEKSMSPEFLVVEFKGSNGKWEAK